MAYFSCLHKRYVKGKQSGSAMDDLVSPCGYMIERCSCGTAIFSSLLDYYVTSDDSKVLFYDQFSLPGVLDHDLILMVCDSVCSDVAPRSFIETLN